MAGLVQEYILGKPCRQNTAALRGDRAVRARRRRARPSRNLLVADEQQQKGQQPEQPTRLHSTPFTIPFHTRQQNRVWWRHALRTVP